MSLPTPARVQEALRVLGALDLKALLVEQVSKNGNDDEKVVGGEEEPLKITLRGLQSMQTAPRTSVLYTSPVDADKRLYSFCDRLRSAFADAGCLVKDKRPLLLHATLVNTVYVPGARATGPGHGQRRPRLTFDAREVLKAYEGMCWMRDVRVEKVAICRMGAVKQGDGEEEYGIEGELEMPV